MNSLLFEYITGKIYLSKLNIFHFIIWTTQLLHCTLVVLAQHKPVYLNEQFYCSVPGRL